MENQLTIKSVSRKDATVELAIETEAGMENLPVFEFRCSSIFYAELLQKSIQRGLKNHSDANNEATAEAYEQGYLQGWDDHRKKNRKAY